MAKILIVDDNALMRKMLRQLIESEEDYHQFAEAGSIEDALHVLTKEPFDILLVDISLQGREGGIQLIELVRQLGKTTPILSVSLYEQSLYEDPLRKAGAQGYLMKQDAVENIVPAIHQLLEGKSYWPAAAERH